MSNTVNLSKKSMETYGIASIDKGALLACGKLILLTAGGDGEISKPEMDWFLENFKTDGAPQDVIDILSKFDFAKSKAEDIIKEIPGGLSLYQSKIVLYNAVKMAYADHEYALGEHQTVARIGKLLGVNSATIKMIECLVAIEVSADKLRLALFHS
jgi:uncharacterized tellurite resistance protein B-like protein